MITCGLVMIGVGVGRLLEQTWPSNTPIAHVLTFVVGFILVGAGTFREAMKRP